MSWAREHRWAPAPTVIWFLVEIIPPRVKEPVYRLYELRLRQGLAASKSELPRHIAVLCDGNRRWARDAGYDDVSYGYRMGAAKIAEMLRWCQEAGIEMATVYLLSTENLQPRSGRAGRADRDHHRRRRGDLRAGQPVECAHGRGPGAARRGTRAPAARCRRGHRRHGQRQFPRQRRGRIRRPPGDHRRRARAAEQGIANGATGEQLVEAVTVDAISENLYTSGQPDPDLVIRTSGEQRLSGFLLWQSAYSEMWFTEAHWPAFRRVDFLRALRDYSQRHRRYGA